MKKIMILMLAFLLVGGATEVQAQSWLKKLGKKVEEKAKQKVEEKAEKAVDKVFDKAEDAATDAVTGKGKKDKPQNNDAGQDADAEEQVAQDGGQQQGGQSLEMAYAKNDFVPGDEIIFEDNMVGEQLGEFPSQWDLISGDAEVSAINGKNCISFEGKYGEAYIAPLMKNPKEYLTDEFTVELDFWIDKPKTRQSYWIIFYDTAKKKEVMTLEINNLTNEGKPKWNYLTPSGEKREGSADYALERNAWNHLSISFNKRAFKAYINGFRVANVPAVEKSANITFRGRYWDTDKKTVALTNVRIAKGAVPLYDRMMSDGKFITYGITFDVGKSVIKPESMGEINRIVQLMNENPDLKFSVEGHTDSTGNATSNQTLSEARSKAIVDKLVEMGIAADRLTSSGKGQTTPIADNGTDEGRAKNRRVEFVKI